MNACENHPSTAECSLHDCRRSVRIFSYNRTPTGKLRTIFPVLIERCCTGTGNRHCCLANPAILSRIKAESHARSEIQTVEGQVSGKESAATYSQIVQSFVHRVAHVHRCSSNQTIAHVDEVSARNNQQTMLPKLRLGQIVQPGRIHENIIEVSIAQYCFECGNVTGRSALPVEQKDGSSGFLGPDRFSGSALTSIAATPRSCNCQKQRSTEDQRATPPQRHAE